MRKTSPHGKASIVKFLTGLMAFIAIIICNIKIVTAVQYNPISVSGTTGNITVRGNTIDNLTITPTLVFNTTGDSITYKMTLSSQDNEIYQIKNISDDNTNQYIATSYQYDKGKDTSNKDIYMTLKYSTYLPFGDELNLRDIHITIDIDSEATPADDNGTSTNTNGTTTDLNFPNTGGNGAKFLDGSASQSGQILPYIIIYIIAIAVIITVTPLPRKYRMQFSKVISIALAVTISGIMFNAHAESTKLEVTIVGTNISANPDPTNPQEVVSINFPNIYNNKVDDRPSGTAPGNAIILKTLDNKYVLMDTGPSTDDIRQVIYDTLKSMQNSDHVVIDYLVISHLDSDHYGNATALMSNSNFTFKNVIFKHEVYANGAKENVFQSIAQTAATHNVNIITSGDTAAIEYLNSIGVTNYDKVTEGMTIAVGKYLKLDLFNTANVYDGKPCGTGIKLSWTANPSASNLYKTSDNKYVYFDGSEYQTKQSGIFDITSSKYPYADVTLKTTTTPVAKENGSGLNRYFYAADSNSHNICQSNPNAFGVLAEVLTTNLKRYMYFPGDIENAGFGMLSSGANSSQLYESLSFENGDFQNNITPYIIGSEDDTATTIYNKLAADANSLGVPVDTLLNNIVIYQESHHGGNNSEKAVWKLNLNRNSGVYAIAETATNMSAADSWNATKTYWYTLGNLPAQNKLQVGTNTKDGVNCTISSVGATTCAHY